VEDSKPKIQVTKGLKGEGKGRAGVNSIGNTYSLQGLENRVSGDRKAPIRGVRSNRIEKSETARKKNLPAQEVRE
jgi:hypothetical protein